MKWLKELISLYKSPLFFFRSTVGRFLVILGIIVGVYIIFVSQNPVKFLYLIREDGPIEYGSALFWLFASLISMLTILKIKKKSVYFLFFYILLTLFFITCGGEEISWGQRLFHIQGFEAVKEINKQHEINFHDIGHISIFSNVFFLLTVLFFIAYPYLIMKNRQLRDFVIRNNLPMLVRQSMIVFLVSLFIWLFLGLRFGTLGFSPLSIWHYYTQMDDEIFELYAAYSFFAFALLDLKYKLHKIE